MARAPALGLTTACGDGSPGTADRSRPTHCFALELGGLGAESQPESKGIAATVDTIKRCLDRRLLKKPASDTCG